MHVKKGRNAWSAVYAICGVGRGTIERNGSSSEGVEGCRDPSIMQASSARLLACSQARVVISVSSVPPTLPSRFGLAAVSHVLIARLVLASSWYVWPDA